MLSYHLCNRSMRVTTSDNGITNAIEIFRPPHGQVGVQGIGVACAGHCRLHPTALTSRAGAGDVQQQR